MIVGFQLSRAIGAMVEIGVPDRIPVLGSISVEELSAQISVLSRPLLRFLRFLAARGIFKFNADGSVCHTESSLLLRQDAADTLYYAARFWCQRGTWNAWFRIDAALIGEIPHQTAWGMSRFAYLREHPQEARAYDEMMAHFPEDRLAAFAEAYDFTTARTITDIGGGNGRALQLMLARAREARGILFDTETVIAAVDPSNLLGKRIAPLSGSFFESLPNGSDIYTLIWILHDWPDAECIRILDNCRAAMNQNSVLLIGEITLNPIPAAGAELPYMVDLAMMVMFGTACERTAREYQNLLERAGLVLKRVIATKSFISILEATLPP